MKQLFQTQHGGNPRVGDVPVPALRPGGVLVLTACSLISAGTERAKVALAEKSLIGKARARPEQLRQVIGSLQDNGILATWQRVSNRLKSLQPLGYSCSGTVVAVGPGAEEFAVGDRVACSGAGFANHAEVVFVPKNLCVKLTPAKGCNRQGWPDRESTASLEEAAFATAGAIALHGVRQADVRLGESVAVVGLGLIGLLVVQILKCSGATVLGLDLDSQRCDLARSLGCDATETVASHLLDRTATVTAGRGVDAVILAAASPSSEPIEVATRLCRDRGRVVVVGDVGMDVPRRFFYEKELELRISRSYGPGRYDPEYEEKGHDYPIGYVRWTEKRNIEEFLKLLASRQVKVAPLITHRFRIEEASDAYQLIAQASEPYLGIILQYVDESRLQDNRFLADIAINPPAITIRPNPSPLAMNIGFIGAGHFAQGTLLPAFRSDKRVHLRGVVTASGLSARSVAERFDFDYCSSRPEDIFQDPEIKAVVIATRHDLHSSLVEHALRAKKHVLVEKPLTVNADQLQRLMNVYHEMEQTESSSLPLCMVGFNRRFSPAIHAMKELFRNCVEPMSLHYRINAGPIPLDHWLHDPAIGGGRLVGEGCHFVDLLAFIAGSPVVEVSAHELANDGRFKQDNLLIQMQFTNGSIAVLQYLANGDRRVGKERLEVFGGGCAAIVDDFKSTVVSRAGRERRIPRWMARQDKGHKAEISAFLKAIYYGDTCPISFWDAAQSTYITFKIQESLRKRKAISIDFDEFKYNSFASAPIDRTASWEDERASSNNIIS
jgi:predicted dehydrogenase/threonine dehydrogenase-like Zn-dependent dehydrogenase